MGLPLWVHRRCLGPFVGKCVIILKALKILTSSYKQKILLQLRYTGINSICQSISFVYFISINIVRKTCHYFPETCTFIFQRKETIFDLSDNSHIHVYVNFNWESGRALSDRVITEQCLFELNNRGVEIHIPIPRNNGTVNPISECSHLFLQFHFLSVQVLELNLRDLFLWLLGFLESGVQLGYLNIKSCFLFLIDNNFILKGLK